MKKEEHIHHELCDNCQIDEDMKENLDQFKNILNCDELNCEKCYYCNLLDNSFSCLLYYSEYEPPGIVYHQINSKNILVYIIRSQIKNNNNSIIPEIIEIYHFNHIFEFSLFSEEEILHFRESLNSLLFDDISNLLTSDFQYTIYE